MDIPRDSRRKLRNPNLTPLIDVLFILIIFFMLTTSFMRIESLELILPSVSAKAADSQDMVHLFVYANGDIALGQRKIDPEELTGTLTRVLQKDPNTRIMVLTADGVSVQQLVDVMDRIYLMGGKSLFVRKWDTPKKAG
jgi:biopolymer transport protein ExbD